MWSPAQPKLVVSELSTDPPKRRSVFSALKKAILALGILGVVFFILYLASYLLEPTSPIKSLLASNISDHQVSLSWVTDLPTKSNLVISSKNDIPTLPFFTKSGLKEDLDRNLRKSNYYLLHQTTITNLSKKQTYYFKIFQGLKTAYQGKFTTGESINVLLNPNPVYGTIYLNQQKTPAVGALVYLLVEGKEGKSSVLSTQTNKSGRWSIDLANLRTLNLKDVYQIASNSSEQLIIEAGKKGKGKAKTTFGKDKPWPDLILK